MYNKLCKKLVTSVKKTKITQTKQKQKNPTTTKKPQTIKTNKQTKATTNHNNNNRKNIPPEKHIHIECLIVSVWSPLHFPAYLSPPPCSILLSNGELKVFTPEI